MRWRIILRSMSRSIVSCRSDGSLAGALFRLCAGEKPECATGGPFGTGHEMQETEIQKAGTARAVSENSMRT